MLRVASALALVLSAQFAFANPNSQVNFMPEQNPIAISADLTIGPDKNGNEKVIHGPWYSFRHSLTNNSPYRLKVVTYKLSVTGVKNGTSNTTQHEIDPGADCAANMSRPFVAVVEPGETFVGNALDSSGEPFSRCDANSKIDPLTGEYEGWFIQSLPATDHYIYNVDIAAEGWFEDVNTGAVIERYTGTGKQTTR